MKEPQKQYWQTMDSAPLGRIISVIGDNKPSTKAISHGFGWFRASNGEFLDFAPIMWHNAYSGRRTMLMTADEARELTEQAIADAQTLDSIMWKIHARTQIREYYLELPFVPNELVRHRLKSQGFLVQVCSKSLLLITWPKAKGTRSVIIKIEDGICLRENGTEFFRATIREPIGNPTHFKLDAGDLPAELYFQARAQIALGIPLWLEAEIQKEADRPENYDWVSFKVARSICLLGL